MAGSIMPGWANTGSLGPPKQPGGSVLPSWYGVGGARGPSGGGPGGGGLMSSLMPPPMPKNINAGNAGVGGISAGIQAPGTGRVATQDNVQTAPTNPWLANQSNQNIYPDKPDFSMIDQLMQQVQAGGQQGQGDFNSRLNSINQLNPQSYQAEKAQYGRAPEMNEAIANLKDWMKTGGFSDRDLSAIRARGTSPVRSIYALANQKLNRQKSLQGGYAPGMAAALSRMAREQSDQLGDIVSKVEADIAEKVQSGKKLGLDKYSSMAGDENVLMNQFAQQNAQAGNQAAQFNAGAANQFGLTKEQMKQGVLGEKTNQQQGVMDQLLKLAQLKEQMNQSNLSGRLGEREGSRAGSLGWEQMNQQGGIALMNALMQQYGGR